MTVDSKKCSADIAKLYKIKLLNMGRHSIRLKHRILILMCAHHDIGTSITTRDEEKIKWYSGLRNGLLTDRLK